MPSTPWRYRQLWSLLSLGTLLLGSCSSGSNREAPNQPAAETRAKVAVLAVVDRHIASHADDALGTPPEDWQQHTDSASFHRSLAYADWQVRESKQQQSKQRRGTTAPDGRLTIDTIPAGQYTLDLSKTLNGNLVKATIPLTVHDTGETSVVVELAQGLVRIVSTHYQGSSTDQEIHSADGNRLVLRNGQLHTLSDGVRTLTDSNEDGQFDQCQLEPDATPCPVTTPTTLSIGGGTPVVLGQPGWVYALAEFADGTVMDVTELVAWQSSEPTVAQVDGWGLVTTLSVGTTRLTATLGTLRSRPWALSVMERPPLARIYVNNTSCYPLWRGRLLAGVPSVVLTPGDSPTAGTIRPALQPKRLPLGFVKPLVGDAMILPMPECTAVIEIGHTRQFSATGEFSNADGSLQLFEDITASATWQLTAATVGDVTAGLFSARQEGTTQLMASLEGVSSEATEIRVVTQATLLNLSIYTDRGQIVPVFVADALGTIRAPECEACGFALTVLSGDQLQWHATAFYDTGAWRDMSAAVTWESSDPTVAAINAEGRMTASSAGEVTITASLQGVHSLPAQVQIVDQATLQSLWIVPEGDNLVVQQGGQAFFQAFGFYDVGFDRDVTSVATWHSSDASVGSFTAPGEFTGHAAGTVEVWATLDAQHSERFTLEVFATSTLDYCDPANINRATWSDAFNRVVLESNCATYTQPAVAAFRFTATEFEQRFGIFNPCLDLYVYQGDRRIRTIREEGCGEPFTPPGRANAAAERLLYQLQAFWDLKADDGTAVPAGTYTIYGRFYLYEDPVVQLNITVR